MPGHWHRTSNNKNVIGDWEIYIKDKCWNNGYDIV